MAEWLIPILISIILFVIIIPIAIYAIWKEYKDKEKE